MGSQPRKLSNPRNKSESAQKEGEEHAMSHHRPGNGNTPGRMGSRKMSYLRSKSNKNLVYNGSTVQDLISDSEKVSPSPLKEREIRNSFKQGHIFPRYRQQ